MIEPKTATTIGSASKARECDDAGIELGKEIDESGVTPFIPLGSLTEDCVGVGKLVDELGATPTRSMRPVEDKIAMWLNTDETEGTSGATF